MTPPCRFPSELAFVSSPLTFEALDQTLLVRQASPGLRNIRTRAISTPARLPAETRSVGHHAEHQPPRELLGQLSARDLLLDADARSCSGRQLRDARRGTLGFCSSWSRCSTTRARRHKSLGDVSSAAYEKRFRPLPAVLLR